MMRYLLGLLTVCLLLTISLASADPIRVDVYQDETVVSDYYQHTNWSNNLVQGGLFVGRSASSIGAYQSRSYMKFAVGAAIPEGATVTSATLHVYLNAKYYPDDLDVDAYIAGNWWNESTITWANAPGFLSPTPLDTVTPPFIPQNWYAWDVTGALAGGVPADGMITLVLRENQEGVAYAWKYFVEREFNSSLGAYLTLEVATTGEAPTADAGPDQTIEQTSPAGAEVTLDASGSAPDGLNYTWSEDGTVLGTSAVLTTTFSAGMHTIELTVTNGTGQSDSDEVVVTVADTTAPTAMFEVLQPKLWPPNHQMVLAAALSDVSDAADPAPIVEITVGCNEAANGGGDGNTDADWQIVENEGVWEIWLRAERAGGAEGRIYTIEATVTDASGNAMTADGTVTVPHDKGRGPKK